MHSGVYPLNLNSRNAPGDEPPQLSPIRDKSQILYFQQPQVVIVADEHPDALRPQPLYGLVRDPFLVPPVRNDDIMPGYDAVPDDEPVGDHHLHPQDAPHRVVMDGKMLADGQAPLRDRPIEGKGIPAYALPQYPLRDRIIR